MVNLRIIRQHPEEPIEITASSVTDAEAGGIAWLEFADGSGLVLRLRASDVVRVERAE